MKWQPPETAPKDGKPFLITTAGHEMDICVWVQETEATGHFVDYYFGQRVPQTWPHMIGWKRLGRPASIGDSEEETRIMNRWR